MNRSPNSNVCGISVDNFGNNEIVDYTVIILKGRLKKRCDTCNREIFVRFRDTERCYSIFENKFKILLEINASDNLITLKTKCCHARLDLNLILVPRKSEFSVTPLYIICTNHSGRFQSPKNVDNSVESACERIVLGAKLLQSLFAEKLYESSLGRKTFQLNLAENGQGCTVFYSTLDKSVARSMKSEHLWEYFGREIMHSDIGNRNTKYLAFLSCTKYDGAKFSDNLKTHADFIGITDAYVALGGGGLAVFGAACLYTWPKCLEHVFQCFEDKTAIDKTKYLDDTCYRGTYGACFSTTLGSVCHELSHAFDLGHTTDGIMSRGFDNVDIIFSFSQNAVCCKKKEPYWTKSCSVLLAYHPWFNSKPTEAQTIVFNKENKVIKSTSGIRVIEVRRETDEMVLYDWTFAKKPLRFDFQLPTCDFMTIERKLVLVAENDSGFILKEPFSLS